MTTPSMSPSDRIKCTAWEFDMNDQLGNTWMSEWNLVCDSEYLKIVGEMVFLVGVASGGVISGYLSDRFGRKMMLFSSAIFQTLFGKLNDHHKMYNKNAQKKGSKKLKKIFSLYPFKLFDQVLLCMCRHHFVSI